MNSDLVSLFTPYQVATPSNLPIMVKPKITVQSPKLAAAEPARAASTSRKHEITKEFVEKYFKNQQIDQSLKYKNIQDSMIKVERFNKEVSQRSRSQRMAQKQQILQMISHVENMPKINEKVQLEQSLKFEY